jgi:hypothetical protein
VRSLLNAHISLAVIRADWTVGAVAAGAYSIQRLWRFHSRILCDAVAGRKAVARRRARVRDMLHTLPPKAQQAIRDDLEGTHDYRQGGSGDGSGDRGYHDEDTETATTPASHRR